MMSDSPPLVASSEQCFHHVPPWAIREVHYDGSSPNVDTGLISDEWQPLACSFIPDDSGWSRPCVARVYGGFEDSADCVQGRRSSGREWVHPLR